MLGVVQYIHELLIPDLPPSLGLGDTTARIIRGYIEHNPRIGEVERYCSDIVEYILTLVSLRVSNHGLAELPSETGGVDAGAAEWAPATTLRGWRRIHCGAPC